MSISYIASSFRPASTLAGRKLTANRKLALPSPASFATPEAQAESLIHLASSGQPTEVWFPNSGWIHPVRVVPHAETVGVLIVSVIVMKRA